jgi:integrase
MRVQLTDRFCSTARADSQVDYFDAQVSGLALRVSRTVKSWSLHFSRPDGRRARLSLGRYPQVSLAAARARALEAKAAIAAGRDPRPTESGTLKAIVDEYFRREGASLRSAKGQRSVFDRLILPAFGERPIGDIRRSEIVRLIDDVADRNGPRAAGVMYAYLGKVMNWHARRDDDFRSPLVRGMAKSGNRARDRILTDDEIRAVWIGAGDFGAFGRLVRFLLLTAVRRNEAARMTLTEVRDGIWTIPAERMKGGLDHVVPLSGAARAMLPLHMVPLTGAEGFIFTVDGATALGGFGYWKRKLDEAVPLAKPWTLHDLRRTARSLMARAGVKEEVGEQCLAHVIGGVRGVYNRHAYLDEKRQAFEALAALVERIVNPQPNVVTLRG